MRHRGLPSRCFRLLFISNAAFRPRCRLRPAPGREWSQHALKVRFSVASPVARRVRLGGLWILAPNYPNVARSLSAPTGGPCPAASGDRPGRLGPGTSRRLLRLYNGLPKAKRQSTAWGWAPRPATLSLVPGQSHVVAQIGARPGPRGAGSEQLRLELRARVHGFRYYDIVLRCRLMTKPHSCPPAALGSRLTSYSVAPTLPVD